LPGVEHRLQGGDPITASSIRPTQSKGIRRAGVSHPDRPPQVVAGAEESDRHVDVEDPWPVKVVRDESPRRATTGAIGTVVDARAPPRRWGGWLASSRVWDSGIIGPATSPCSTRTRSAVPARRRSAQQDTSVNSSTLATNSRTCPNRAASHR
jgi:hypothetical protein